MKSKVKMSTQRTNLYSDPKPNNPGGEFRIYYGRELGILQAYFWHLRTILLNNEYKKDEF